MVHLRRSGEMDGAVIVDEAGDGIAGLAQIAAARMPDADLAPIAFFRNVDGADATFDHAGARPVGVVEKNFAVIENLGDCGNVAVAHRTEARHRHDGADARLMPAAVPAFGLVPPGVGIAAQFNAGNFTGERNTLQGTGGRECRRDQGCKR